MSRTTILWLSGGIVVVLLGLWGASLYVEIQKNRAIHTVERRVKVIERFIGPQGEKGKPGKPGKPGKRAPVPIETLKDIVTQIIKQEQTTGPMGPTGKSGKSGINGANGANGRRGPRGLRGPQGIQGPQGVQGVQGQPGVPGPQGIPGPACPPGYVGQTLMIPLKVTDKPVTVFLCVKH